MATGNSSGGCRGRTHNCGVATAWPQADPGRCGPKIHGSAAAGFVAANDGRAAKGGCSSFDAPTPNAITKATIKPSAAPAPAACTTWSIGSSWGSYHQVEHRLAVIASSHCLPCHCHASDCLSASSVILSFFLVNLLPAFGSALWRNGFLRRPWE